MLCTICPIVRLREGHVKKETSERDVRVLFRLEPDIQYAISLDISSVDRLAQT